MMKTFASPRVTAHGSIACVAVAIAVAFALGACGGGWGSSSGDETVEEQLGFESVLAGDHIVLPTGGTTQYPYTATGAFSGFVAIFI